MRLTGQQAIQWAEDVGYMLSKYADPIEPARDGLTPAEAREIARQDASLVYLETTDDMCVELSAQAHDVGGLIKATSDLMPLESLELYGPAQDKGWATWHGEYWRFLHVYDTDEDRVRYFLASPA